MQHTLCSHALRELVAASLLASSIPAALATCYQVDFAAGDDARNGLSPDTAFKHSPGDSAATGLAAAVKLLPGDSVRFKGGVIYRGTVGVKASGEAGKPIVFDGNTDGTWGTGKAIIDGGAPITGWQRCASAAEAKGNVRWAEIFHVDVPRPTSFKELNLCDGTTVLPISQQPNPKNPFWQEDISTYQVATGLLVSAGGTRLAAEKGTHEHKDLPLSGLLIGEPALIDPVPGAGFTCTLDQAQTIVAVGLAVQPQYAAIKEVVVLGDGKELLHFDLAKDDKGTLQRFELPAPATVSSLTFRFLSMYEPKGKNDWSKIRQIAAFTKDGTNPLKGAGVMTFTDKAYLNQPEADWYDGMTFGFFGGHAFVIEEPILGYNPATGTVQLKAFAGPQYKQTQYCLFNSVRLIDQPGEYSVEATADPKISRIFLLPRTVKDGQPVDIAISTRKVGFALEGASYITVQGFTVRRQNAHALLATGPAAGVVFRHCEATLVRGVSAIECDKIQAMTVAECQVHDNPGHTRGIVLHTCSSGSVVRGCNIVRNTATALDYYTTIDSQVIGNTVLEHHGMHGNGLTFYVGCRNILVEGNRVANGNNGMTMSDATNFIVRNNLFDSSGNEDGMGVCLWTCQSIRDVQLLNNTIVRSDHSKDWTVGLFTNCKDVAGLVVRNNIIDGVDGGHGVFAKGGIFSHNLYTRVSKDPKQPQLGTNNLVELDLKRIFVDPAHDDFHLCAGSPAIGAGTDVGVATDIDGKPRPTTRPPDIGAWAYGK